MKDNMLIVHGGAPTAVMNASLYGAIRAASASGAVGRIYGAQGGTRGVLEGNYIDLSVLPEETLEALPTTPASFIGTSRFPVETGDYDRIVDRLVEDGIRYLLITGGNGSMDTCGKIARAVTRRAPGRGIKVAGIPKTIDNDLAGTDHAPGFGSAARYLAASVAELSQDIASLPIHVCVIESMGRNAGWLTASAALAKPSAWKDEVQGSKAAPGAATGADAVQDDRLGPHLIYVPEIAFDEEKFLDEAKTLYDRLGGVVVVVSEGLRGKDGKPIVPLIFQTGRSVYYGDVSAHLCGLIIRRLGIKARSEKPGVLGRCSIAHQSPVDREEAITAGREAAAAALSGKTGVMVGFRRLSSKPYACETFLVPVEEVMLHERTLPIEYLNAERNGIKESYLDWCGPLLGGVLPVFAWRPGARCGGEKS
ncbi:MAG: 6-phosphofructokinase [Spirochaetes bacterium]|nr:6-phosphofructokinase [Spirochaetota bacterium]